MHIITFEVESKKIKGEYEKKRIPLEKKKEQEHAFVRMIVMRVYRDLFTLGVYVC